MKQAMSVSRGMVAADEVDPRMKNELLSGSINPTDKDIITVARASPDERKELVAKLREPRVSSRRQSVKKDVEDKSNDEDPSEDFGGGQNVHHQNGEKASERIDREIGNSERYVRRAVEFAKGLDAAEELIPGIKKEILFGTIHPSDKDIAAVAKATSEERRTLAEYLKHPVSARRNPSSLFQGEDLEKDEDADIAPVEFKPSPASILAIPKGMDSSTERSGAGVDTEFIILELGDALESMMFRWETCISDYRKEAMKQNQVTKMVT